MSTEHHIIPFLFEAKWGYKDNEGNVLVEPLLDYADDFHEGVAYVELHGKVFPIDEGGDRIDAEYDMPIDGEYSSYESYKGSYCSR